MKGAEERGEEERGELGSYISKEMHRLLWQVQSLRPALQRQACILLVYHRNLIFLPAPTAGLQYGLVAASATYIPEWVQLLQQEGTLRFILSFILSQSLHAVWPRLIAGIHYSSNQSDVAGTDISFIQNSRDPATLWRQIFSQLDLDHEARRTFSDQVLKRNLCDRLASADSPDELHQLQQWPDLLPFLSAALPHILICKPCCFEHKRICLVIQQCNHELITAK